MQTWDLAAAHRHSSIHRDEVLASEVVLCLYCQQSFPPKQITEWIDNEQTALCPRCGIDSIIGSKSGFPVSDAAFVAAMHAYWFQQ